MTRRDRELAAAAELEALIPHLRDVVNEVRAGTVDAYASLYEGRRRLGRIVSLCGYDVPRVAARNRAHDYRELDRRLLP